MKNMNDLSDSKFFKIQNKKQQEMKEFSLFCRAEEIRYKNQKQNKISLISKIIGFFSRKGK
jgi:hypothetical protein